MVVDVVVAAAATAAGVLVVMFWVFVAPVVADIIVE